MSIAELNEGERLYRFAVPSAEKVAHSSGRTSGAQSGSDGDQRSHAEGHAGDFEEFASIKAICHLHLQIEFKCRTGRSRFSSWL